MQKNYLTANILNALVLSVPETAEKKQGTLTGKRIVMIIAERLFHDIEFTELKIIFEQVGAEIIIASGTLSEAIGTFGLRVKPDILISEILVKNFDAVVFIGGAGCLQFSSDLQAHLIGKLALKHGKILAAIDLAPHVLAKAGLLSGKNVNCRSSASSYLREKGAIVTGEDVERDGNIITSTGLATANQFGETIVSALSE